MDLPLDELRATAAGFAGAAVILLVLLFVVGVDDILAALAMARRPILLVVVAVAFSWLLAWSLALRTVLAVLGIPVPVVRALLIYASATFANNITPFGQAGGEPFSALLISRATDSEYETGLAAIASVDALNFIPSILFAFFGIVYYATASTLGRRVEFVAISVLVLALVVPLTAYVGWQWRGRLRVLVARLLTPFLRAVARVVPRLTPPDSASVLRRVDGFFAAIERVADSRRTLLLALSLSALGWLLLSTSLWMSLLALGHAVPFVIVLFIVPVGSIAGVTPLPGGLGSVEAALVLLLVPMIGIDPATAGAAALVHRGATYWLPVLLGGGAVALLEAENA